MPEIENKVPYNLLKTPRGVNPAKRAGFYANEKPEVLGKTLEESSGVPEGAVFPIVETTPETVFVEWGTRPSMMEADAGGSDEYPYPEGSVVLKEGISPVNITGDATVEISFGSTIDELHLKNVDFSFHEDRSITIYNDKSFDLSLSADSGTNTYSLVVSLYTPPLPLTYVKVIILEKTEVTKKLPSEYIEGMPLVVNCSVVDGVPVFDKTFAEIQENDLNQVQFIFGSLNSTNKWFTEGSKGQPSQYHVLFHDIMVGSEGLGIKQHGFTLDSDDVVSYSTYEFSTEDK